MNKVILLGAFILGVLVGALVIIKLFGINDISIPNLPYKNAPVVLEKPSTIEWDKTRITLPKGTELVLVWGDFKFGYYFYLPIYYNTFEEPKYVYKREGRAKGFSGIVIDK